MICTCARAALAAQGSLPFAEAYARAYQQAVPPLSDLDAFTLNRWLARPVYQFREALQHSLDQYRSQPRITTEHAIDLIWTYLTVRCLSQLLDHGDRADPRR